MYNNYYGYDYGYGTQTATGLAAFGAGMLVMWLISMAISVFTIICNWKVFKKAGKPGWASIIPIYNIIVMIEIAELPMWYIALFFVPFANIYASFKINIEIAHKFGKSTGFGVGMTLLSPIFMALLAFSKDANYKGIQNVGVQQTYQQTTMQSAQQVTPTVPVVEPQPINPMPEVQPVVNVAPETPTAPVAEPQPINLMPEVQPVVNVASETPSALVVEPQPINPMSEVQPVVNVVSEAPSAPVVEPQPIMDQPVAPAFCTNCGKSLMPNTKFCTNCGKQI